MSQPLLVLLSGHVSVGKTTLARLLEARLDRLVIASSRRMLLQRLGSASPTRTALQDLGEELDRQTHGAWLYEEVTAVGERTGVDVVVVDAVRTLDQIDHLRAAGTALHVHLKAPTETLADRYERRRQSARGAELATYEQVLANTTEHAVDLLGSVAELTLDTDAWTRSEAASLAFAAIELGRVEKV